MLAIVVLVCVKLCEYTLSRLTCGSIFHYEIITFPERFVSHIMCVFKHAKLFENRDHYSNYSSHVKTFLLQISAIFTLSYLTGTYSYASNNV